jgi:hypothetical protein
MNIFNLRTEIITWLQSQPYWFQVLGDSFLNGNAVSPELIKSCASLFMQSNDLETKLEEVPLSFTNSVVETSDMIEGNLSLKRISNITNVNALVNGQSIEILPKLSIIYGDNGTGKSGYIRLFNNAFDSRGNKKITPNIFSTSGGDATCEFTFTNNNQEISLTYPADKKMREFECFSVFDAECSRILVEEENSLNVTPKGLEIFAKLAEAFVKIKSLLIEQIKEKRATNIYALYFTKANVVSAFVNNLSSESSLTILRSIATLSDQESENIRLLSIEQNKLIALTVDMQLAKYEKVNTMFSEFLSKVERILSVLTTDSIASDLSLLRSRNSAKILSLNSSIESFSDYDIANISNQEWKTFIESARDYITIIQQGRADSHYPGDTDRCIFCLQALNEKQKALIEKYWAYLNGEAAKEYLRQDIAIERRISEIRSIQYPVFNDTSILFEHIMGVYPEFAEKWKVIINDAEHSISTLISRLTSRNEDDWIKPSEDSINLSGILSSTQISNEEDENTRIFRRIRTELQAEIITLKNLDVSKRITEVESQLQELTDRGLLYKLLPEIEAYITNLQWSQKAEDCLIQLRTNKITSKHSELFTEHITEKYIELFNDELVQLKAPKSVAITTHGVTGEVRRRLVIESYNASDILSEGEQKCIGIADFLTEIQLNQRNRGIIFDDPVSSLDHKRRRLIATRLVKESFKRQIIIFTHDIAFVMYLKLQSDELLGEGSYIISTIRKHGNRAGIIDKRVPWLAATIKTRIAYLEEKLVSLRKLESDDNQDEYDFTIKSWYEHLRETWERGVEERLLKGVVTRFEPAVKTQQLKKINVDEELIRMIDQGMASSQWLHDSPASLNPPLPSSTDAEEALTLLKLFKDKCLAP